MKSIRGKLWLGMMGLVAAILLVLWLLQIVFLERVYFSMRVSGIRDSLTAIGQLVATSEQSEAEFELDRLASNQNLTVEWLDASGRTVHFSAGESGSQMPMMHNMVRGEVYTRVLSGQPVQTSVTHPRFGSEYRLIGQPLFLDSGQSAGAMIATVPMAAVAETADILKRQLVYVTLSLLLLTSALSFWMSRGFTRPILQIRQVTAAMAEGDFSAQATYDKPDEIGMLAGSINHLGRQLEKLEQLRRDLVANVSHELRTPLSVIRGYAETIRDISGDDAEQRADQLEIIIEETERLSNLVNDNLHLALLQSGNVRLNLRPFALQELLQDIVEQYTVIASRAGVDLLLEGSADAIVEADQARIAQVVRNLVQNSLQHTAAGGQVSVQIASHPDRVRVVVSDTGSGISPEDLPHIWDKYYRHGSANKGQRTGSGLGLAIVKGILQAHQAEFGVKSDPGQGTAVWFELARLS